MINPKIFKAYDIRGIYPTDLNEEIAYQIARHLARLIKSENTSKPEISALVSRDMRLSSNSLHDSFIKGLADENVNIVDIGLSSTPMFNFAVASAKVDLGIQITASHNPKEYNGFKMTRAMTEAINGDKGIYQVRDAVIKETLPKLNKTANLETFDAKKEYIKRALDFKAEPNKKMRIVVDSANAMAGEDLESFFSNYENVEIIFLNRNLDGSFPAHLANPIKEETLDELKKKVVEEKADFGIATDGDGDRYMFIDKKGNYIRADIINALLARETVKEANGRPILYGLISSRIVPEEITKRGGKAEKCRVGYSFIKPQMREMHAYFTGELSGHYFIEVLPNAYFEFPLYVVAKVIKIISEEGKTLSELTMPLYKYFHTNEFNFKVEDKEKAIKTFEEKYKDSHQFKLDGLSVEYPTWWFNIRPSNTEPLLRFNLEANTKEEMLVKKQEVTDLISSLGGKPE